MCTASRLRNSVSAVDPTNRNTALASALVEELARAGVRDAVVSPGSRPTPLAIALWREPGLETRVIVDERSAGFFALGAAQATRRPVAVLCTSGTAAANLHPAVCEADESAVPLIVLTADRPPELRGIGAGQTIDQLKLYGSAVRWFCEVGTHDADDAGLLHFRSVACRAFAVAAGDPRPGPVHLNVAWRDPLGPEPIEGEVTASSALALEGREGGRPLTSVPTPPEQPAEALVDALAHRVGLAPRGLIVAGRMPASGAATEIAVLARAVGYPILAEPTSQLRLGPHDRELVVAAYEAIARARPEPLAPELVLRFGELPTCKPLRGWLAELQETAQVVIDPARGWSEPTRIAGAIVRADPAAVARALATRIDGAARDPSWRAAWIAAGEAAGAATERLLDAQEGVTEPGLQAALGGAYADGDLVYTASSMPIRDQEAFLAAGAAEVLFLANRGANGIDGLVSSGIGAAAASGRPTVIVTGDLGLLHDLGGLAALRDVATSVRIVVVNNDGGGIFDFLPQAEQLAAHEFEALLGTPRGVSVERAAALFDLPYRRLDDLAELTAALAAGTGLIEVPIDRAANLALHRRLTEEATAAVARAVG
ncbi:MAG: 2-succinyl-5-enolpyruvyl-6-hydroxy-3-cyclohexene-1-carboxylic-acid synthase [Solirubrobacterales bacterium]|nr:2-succinyl-5-enolpyruvyl-6-hydroxy-3-cyclohexene-1-carboxylic-acid synthase [Solirubrobacterales bacterium]